MHFRHLAAALLLIAGTATRAAAQETQLFILSTVTRLHPELSYYDFGELRRRILEVRPDVIVLEVRPDELAERKETPGRPEYPAVVFPLLQEKQYTTYPMEPGEPVFGEMVKSYATLLQKFKETQPDAAATLSAYESAAVAALRACWRSPADVNSPLTDRIVEAKHELQSALIGPERAASWARWNDYMVDAVKRAIAENPSKRILALVGYDNAYWMRARLADLAGARVIDMYEVLGGRPEPCIN
jgi:hypothetical protein